MKWLLVLLLSISLYAKSSCELGINKPLEAKERKVLCHALMHSNFVRSIKNSKKTRGLELTMKDLEALSPQNFITLGSMTSYCYDKCIISLPRVSLGGI